MGRWQPNRNSASSRQEQVAATALGQIYSSMDGGKDVLAHKARMVQCHASALQAADAQAEKDAKVHRSTQEQLKAKQAAYDRLKRRHTCSVRYNNRRVTSMEAGHAAQMGQVVLVEAQRRRDEREQAQATATRLAADLDTALRDKGAVMEQAEAARAEVQAGRCEQQKLKMLLENVLRKSVSSHRLEKAQEERDEASQLATAQKQLAAAKAEAATASEQATKEAGAATILRKELLQLNRWLCVPGQKKEKEKESAGRPTQAHPLAKESSAAAPAVVQGKAAAAADQHGLPPPRSVPQPVAKAMPLSGPVPDSEGSIKAVLAGKTQQVKQEAQRLRQRLSVSGQKNGTAVASTAEVQGRAAAADQHVSSVPNFVVAEAAPQPMPKSDTEAGIKAAIEEKAKQLKQLADKGGGHMDKAYVSVVREIAELEGQAAYVYYVNKQQIMPEGKCSNALLQDTATLVSCDFDIQARKKYRAASRKEQAGSWKWVASPFSRAVRTLAPRQAVAAQIGRGGRSIGFVNYAEVLLADGQVVPCALKKLKYGECILAQMEANAELAALRDAEGCPHLAHCYGAFEMWCPQEKQHCLWLVMEYAEGLSCREAYRQLQKLRAEAGYMDMHYTASKLLMQHVLKGLQWLHKRGRAMCDLKPDNIRIQMGRQPGTFTNVTLIDMGGSVKYKGPLAWAPITMGHNIEHLCPEYARSKLLDMLDCCSHDMWGAGCLMYRAFTGTAAWAIPTIGCHMTDCATLSKRHEAWAKALTVPNAVATAAHPLLSDLQWAVSDRAYPQAAALLVQLLQPDVHNKATAEQALASQFFTGDR